MTKINCLRCGQCCHYLKQGFLVKCKYLMKLGNGKTFCRIYPTRLGTEIDKGVYCSLESEYNFKNCPFNRENKKNGYCKTANG